MRPGGAEGRRQHEAQLLQAVQQQQLSKRQVPAEEEAAAAPVETGPRGTETQVGQGTLLPPPLPPQLRRVGEDKCSAGVGRWWR